MSARKAIITGSIKYARSPLNYPLKDIEIIGNTLQKRCLFEGSDILNILHSDKVEDNNYLESIRSRCIELNLEKSNSYDLIVFYYSGHGIFKVDEQMSFLQISDDTSIAIDEVISIISEVKAKNKYFIIDACQSGGFTLMKSKGKIERKYAYNSEGVYCMFGTTKNQLAFEPTLKEAIRKKIHNSFYTHFIAEALNTKSNYIEDTVSIRVVDDYASRKTPTYTNFDQIPFSTTEIKGYFPFGFWTDEKELIDIDNWVSKETLPVQHSTDIEVDIINYLHIEIQRFYSNDGYYLTIPDRELLENLSQPARDILNERLDLINMKYDEKPLINGLICSNSKHKYDFLITILEQSAINIDLTLKDDLGNTVLFEAINNYRFDSYKVIQLIFKRGYKMTDDEENNLIEIFESNSTRPELMENIVIALVCNKLTNIELIEKSRSMLNVIFTLYSFKTKKVVGYKLNLTALANNFLNSYKGYFLLFIKALKCYNYYDILKTKHSFVKKESDLMQSVPFQETEHDDVLKKIFPELYE